MLNAHMAWAGVRFGGQSSEIRMVLHRNVTDAALDVAINAFKSYFPAPELKTNMNAIDFLHDTTFNGLPSETVSEAVRCFVDTLGVAV